MAAGQVWLAGEDAAELAQMLEFVDDWLGGPDRQLSSIPWNRGDLGCSDGERVADLVEPAYRVGQA
jgi:hypothetical protein